MKKKAPYICILLACAACLGVLIGCGEQRTQYNYIEEYGKGFHVSGYNYYGRSESLYCNVNCIDFRLCISDGTNQKKGNPDPTKRMGYEFLGVFDGNGRQYFDAMGMRIGDVTDGDLGNHRKNFSTKWQAETGYTLRFDSGDGAPVADIEGLTYDQDIEKLPVPAPADGKRFVGWYCDRDMLYQTTDGEGNPLYGIGDKFSATEAQMKEYDYRFDKYKFWDVGVVDNRKFCELNHYEFCEYINRDINGRIPEREDKTVTLYAKYESNDFDVTFDFGSEHGDIAPRTITLEPDKTVADISAEFDAVTDGEYGIYGWALDSGDMYDGEPITENITLSAVWKKFRTVTARGDGYDDKAVRVYEDAYVYTDRLFPARDGYALDGFYASPTFTGFPVAALEYGGAVSVIYAKQTPVDYTIRYLTDGTLLGGASVPDAAYNIETNTFDLYDGGDGLQNYELVGWHEEDSDEILTKIEKGSTGDMYLYPVLRGKEITLNLNHSVTPDMQYVDGDRPATVKVRYGDRFTISPVRNLGYRFLGWCTEPNGGGELITDGEGKAYAASAFTQSVTLYAHWECGAEIITVSFVEDDGKVTTVKAEKGGFLPLYTPTKAGKIFVGWFSSTGARYRDDDRAYEDVTLYAKWADAEGEV